MRKDRRQDPGRMEMRRIRGMRGLHIAIYSGCAGRRPTYPPEITAAMGGLADLDRMIDRLCARLPGDRYTALLVHDGRVMRVIGWLRDT